MRFLSLVLFTLLSVNLYASGISELLLDIQKHNSLNLAKHNLHLGWNPKDKVFISKGISIFDYTKNNYIENIRKNHTIAMVDSMSGISKFLKTISSSSQKLENENLSLKYVLKSNNLLNKILPIYTKIIYEKNDVCKIEVYTILYPKVKKIHSNTTLERYIKSLDLSHYFGNRLFIDKRGSLYILTFSYYEAHKNPWKDKLSANYLAKRDILSMLNSNLKSFQSLSKDKQINDTLSEQERSINLNSKNIKKVTQKMLVDKISKQRYYITIYSYKAKL